MGYTIVPYLAIFLLEIVIFANIRGFREKQPECFWFLFIQFFIIFAFRAQTVLADTFSYYQHFRSVKDSLSIGTFDTNDRFERGYLLYEQVIHRLSENNFLIFQIITTTIILGGTMWFLYKRSKCTWMVFFLYVMTRFMFSEIIAARQGIAIVMALWSFQYLERKEYLKYCIGIFIAYSFHTSALVMLSLIPLYFNSILTRTKIVIVCITALAFFIGYSYFIDTYIEGIYAETNKASGINPVGVFATIMALTLFLYAAFIRKIGTSMSESRINDPFMLISLIYLLVSVLSMRLWILIRILLYFTPFMLLYISNLYATCSKSIKIQVATCCLFIFLTATFLFMFSYRPEWIGLFPYSFYA